MAIAPFKTFLVSIEWFGTSLFFELWPGLLLNYLGGLLTLEPWILVLHSKAGLLIFFLFPCFFPVSCHTLGSGIDEISKVLGGMALLKPKSIKLNLL